MIIYPRFKGEVMDTEIYNYLQEIKNAHYATSINYVQNVYAVITKWNLTVFDNFGQNKVIIKNDPQIFHK